MEIIEFIFRDVWHICSAALLILAIGEAIAEVIRAVKGKEQQP